MAGRIRRSGDSLSFRVRLTPKGGRNAIDGWSRDAGGSEHLKVRVASPPEDGKANTALLALLAAELEVPKSTIQIVSGERGRVKTVQIAPTTALASARLNAMETAK